MITSQSDSVSAVGFNWHPEHFVCAGRCARSLATLSFLVLTDEDKRHLRLLQGITDENDAKFAAMYDDESKAWCEDCYNDLFSTPCGGPRSCCFTAEK